MTTNLLNALINIYNNPNNDIRDLYLGRNRINNIGDGLEYYIKDAFCNSFNHQLELKPTEYEHFFSYQGNSNNPPDFIIKNGPAIEVKKLENISGSIQLNSSYPKSKLYSNDRKITAQCRNCEDTAWTEKEMIYAIGCIPKNSNKIRLLWFIDGTCYAADNAVYEHLFTRLSDTIETEFGEETHDSEELARFNNVDPKGATSLRVRSMWILQNPLNLFNCITYNRRINAANYTVVMIIEKTKYDAFQNKSEFEEIVRNSNGLISIQITQIPSPNNIQENIDIVAVKMVL